MTPAVAGFRNSLTGAASFLRWSTSQPTSQLVRHARGERPQGSVGMPGRFAGHRPVMAELLESRVLMAASPIISEFLASNDINSDEDGDASDWVEIYNPNPTPISLNGYYLTDKSSEPTKWKFPNVS